MSVKIFYLKRDFLNFINDEIISYFLNKRMKIPLKEHFS